MTEAQWFGLAAMAGGLAQLAVRPRVRRAAS
jgi:hypothetical protein